MSRPIIEVNGLSKRYRLGEIGFSSFREETERLFDRLRGRAPAPDAARGSRDFWALRDVSFSVQPGEVLGIIGRNGAGKSTLLKLLSRITEPTAGEIVLRGRVASLLEVGTGFHPELSGRDNIFLNGAILGMRRAEIAGKFDEIVAFAEVERFIDTPVKRYSSGMYVRLAFAVAAHLEPDILVVDEVLAVGDVRFQKKCVAKMAEVSGHGRTVLFVTHNLGLAAELCRTGLLLEHGRVVERGPIHPVIKRYHASGAEPGEGGAARREADSSQPGGLLGARLSALDESGIVTSGSGFSLEIACRPGPPGLGVLAQVRDANGMGVLHFNTAFASLESLSLAAPQGRYLLRVPRVFLPPGLYTIDLESWSPQGRVDQWARAVSFEVAEGYLDGIKTDSFKGRCAALVPHEWGKA